MINVIAGQSIIDIALQEQRNPLFAFELAFGNGISITDELSSETPLNKFSPKDLDKDFSNIVTKSNPIEEIIATEGQTALEIALQEYRNPLFAFDIAFANDISVDALFAVEQSLIIPKFNRADDLDFSNINLPVFEPVLKIIAISSQSIIDIAIQESGTPFSSIDWLLKNGINITDLIAPGTVLKDPEPSEVNVEIKNYFKSRGLKVATYYNKDINTDYLEYILPGEFPYSF
jgi:hypothetical protein